MMYLAIAMEPMVLMETMGITERNMKINKLGILWN